MAHTNAWNEASPAGTDLASTADDHMRQIKLDVREREALDHVWNTSLDNDGKHKKVTFHPEDNTAIVSMSQSPSLTGANAQSFVHLTQTWNTTGVPTLIKANVTDTASGAASLLLDLQVGGITKFSVKKDGTMTFTGAIVAQDILTVTGFGSHKIMSGGAGGNTLTVQNNVAGVGNFASFILGNDLSAAGGAFTIFTTTYTTAGAYIQNGVLLESIMSGGLSVSAAHATGDIRFYAGGTTERVRITSTGKVGINSNAPNSAMLSITISGATDLTNFGQGIQITSTAATAGQMICFIREATIPVSMGFVYNTSVLAIGPGQAVNSNFTNPVLAIDTVNGRVGVNKAAPTQPLDVVGNASIIGTVFVAGDITVTNGNARTITIQNATIGDAPRLVIGRSSDDWTCGGYIALYNKNGIPYYFWVDAAGKLRIHNAAPDVFSDKDLLGVVVGTQS